MLRWGVVGAPADDVRPDRPAPPGAAAGASPWVLGPVLDLLLICGGGSMLLYAAMRGAVAAGAMSPERTPAIWTAGLYLSFVVNYPHFAATFYRLYRSAESRAEYPLTTYVSPLVVLAASVAAARDPEGFGSWWVKLFLWWNGWHYAGQAMGVAMIYVRKAGMRTAAWHKWALASPGIAAWLLGMTWLESSARHSFYALPVVPFQWDADVVLAAWNLLYATLVLAAVATLDLWRTNGRPPPLAALLPVAAQVLWTTPGAGFRPFAEFIPLCHGLQYLSITLAYHLKEEGLESAPAPTRLGGLAAYWLKIAGLGALGFWLAPKLLERFLGIREDLGQALCIVGINLHHFYIDGIIWKLRSRSVAARLALQPVPAT